MKLDLMLKMYSLYTNVNVSRNTKTQLNYMKPKVDYNRFRDLKTTVMGLLFEDFPPSEKEKIFKSLVDVLIKKSVCKIDGTVQRWRSNALDYFKEISLFMDNPETLVSNPEDFFERFIFAPVGKSTSLYQFVKGGESRIGNTFKGIPVRVLFDYYYEKTGKSPYEKNEKEEIRYFLQEVESIS